MKKIFALLLACILLFSFAGCKDKKYEAQPSTEEESRVMMRLRYDGTTYDVRYELYRAFYLNLRADYPEGTLSHDDKEELEEKILRQIYLLYATLAMCESLDYDIYDADTEQRIEDFITVSVEGGYLGSTYIEGYGSYEEYLASLKELNMNYAVQTLIFRYSIAKSLIDEHYRSAYGIYDDAKREDVEAFYLGENTGRYLTLYLPRENFTYERAAEIADTLAKQTDEDAVFSKMVNYSALNLETLRAGQIITPYNLDPLTYATLTDVALTLSEGEVSDPVALYNSQNNGYIILYKADRSADHLNENYDSIVEEYINDKSGQELDRIYKEISKDVTFYPIYETLDRESIRMN